MKKLLCFIALLCITLFCYGQLPDPQPNTYVNDFAGVLTKDQIHVLNDSIHGIEQRSSVQIAIILVNTLPADIAIEDYAMGIGRKWHVGNANNGLVYVAALDEHKQRLEVAANLEGAIPDITAGNITGAIKPFFRQKDYYGGLLNMLKDINTNVDPVLIEQQKLAEAEQDKISKQRLSTTLHALGWIGLFATCVLGIFIPLHIKRAKQRAKEEAVAQAIAEAAEIASNKRAKEMADRMNNGNNLYNRKNKFQERIEKTFKESREGYIPPLPYVANEPSYKSSSRDDDSSSQSDDDSSSSYGNFGSGSSGSSDSGFSGGGSTDSW